MVVHLEVEQRKQLIAIGFVFSADAKRLAPPRIPEEEDDGRTAEEEVCARSGKIHLIIEKNWKSFSIFWNSGGMGTMPKAWRSCQRHGDLESA